MLYFMCLCSLTECWFSNCFILLAQVGGSQTVVRELLRSCEINLRGSQDGEKHLVMFVIMFVFSCELLDLTCCNGHKLQRSKTSETSDIIPDVRVIRNMLQQPSEALRCVQRLIKRVGLKRFGLMIHIQRTSVLQSWSGRINPSDFDSCRMTVGCWITWLLLLLLLISSLWRWRDEIHDENSLSRPSASRAVLPGSNLWL